MELPHLDYLVIMMVVIVIGIIITSNESRQHFYRDFYVPGTCNCLGDFKYLYWLNQTFQLGVLLFAAENTLSDMFVTLVFILAKP